jgi:hypothetical protein
MKLSALIFAAAVLSFAGAAAHTAEKVDKNTQENEAKLAHMLEGRTAGEPVSCIPLQRLHELKLIYGVALVYDTGDIIYVSRPTNPEGLRRDDVVIIDRHTSELCNSDVIQTVDRDVGFVTGVVFLGKFVPYKKPG